MPDFRALVRRRIAPLNLDGARAAEIVEELAGHLEQRYEDFLRTGSSTADAHRAMVKELKDLHIAQPQSLERLEMGTPRKVISCPAFSTI